MKRLLTLLFVVLFSGCLWQHNIDKARDTAEIFLKALYIENNFDKAYQMCDEKMKKIFGVDFLENTSKKFKSNYQTIDRIIPDAYFFESGDRAITVFFSGLSEKGVSYHKVVLELGKNNEYKIISTFFSDQPFTGYRTIKKFKE